MFLFITTSNLSKLNYIKLLVNKMYISLVIKLNPAKQYFIKFIDLEIP